MGTVFFPVSGWGAEVLNEEEEEMLQMDMQRTLLAMHSRTLGSLEDVRDDGPVQRQARVLVTSQALSDPDIRGALHALTNAAHVPLGAFNTVVARVRRSSVRAR